ncbi:hypothetical protein [uncultured Winogradskyella sp.]|uniref:hypothetical protein n=1 Tax=uncultured Winogradskyella sp. TaxID=395353 RepID=UPI0026139027|nr:hypothetical protein [uncultured Winogradskyella sp.]
MSYTTMVSINGTKQEVFNAISQHVQKWWGNTDNSVSSVGDEFTTSFDSTYWKFRISEFEPNTKIVWKCVEAKHIHNGYDGIEKEWEGTIVEWVLEDKGQNAIILNFAHNGLVPELNCYEICFPAWERFVTQSLKSFVETGTGMPHLS